MPFVAAPGIVEVQLRATFDGQQVMNRFHVDVLHTPTAADCALLAQTAGDWWDTNVQSTVATNVTMRQAYAKSLEVQNGPEATYSAIFPLSGTAPSDSLPNNCSLAISLRTSLTGRSARGRWFWYGFTEDQVDASTVKAGVLATLDAAITNLLSDITGLGFNWVIVSFFSGGGPRVGGPVYFVVDNITIVDAIIDSQRRRLPGRGR